VITWIDKRELGKETANYFYIKRRNIYSNSEQSLITLKKNNRGKTGFFKNRKDHFSSNLAHRFYIKILMHLFFSIGSCNHNLVIEK